jgi:hypothetical protein
MKPEVQFLVHKITEKGLTKTDELTKAITDFLRPTSLIPNLYETIQKSLDPCTIT